MGSEYNRKQIIGDGLEVFLDIENLKSVNVGMGDTIWKSIVGEYNGSLSYSSDYNFNYSDGGASSDGSPSSWMPTDWNRIRRIPPASSWARQKQPRWLGPRRASSWPRARRLPVPCMRWLYPALVLSKTKPKRKVCIPS